MQRQLYSGLKRVQCICFQALTVPDGLVAHFRGPVEGRAHDSTMLRRSGLREYLARNSDVFRDRFVFGDPANGVSEHVVSLSKEASLSAAQRDVNGTMSVCESVEWTFGRMKALWAYVGFSKSHKVMRSPVGWVVRVAMVLTDAHTCLQGGNQVSAYIGMKPPTLLEYFET